MASGSSLGSALSGGADLISAVGSVMPSHGSTTQGAKTRTQQDAASNVTGSESSIGRQQGTESTDKTSGGTSNLLTNNVTDSRSENVTDSRLNRVSDALKSEVSKGTSTTSGTSSTTSKGTEKFSGQDNETVTQTMLTDQAVMRVINMMLTGENASSGLAGIIGGERSAGMFNTSTASQLAAELATRVGGEVARLSAPTVSKEHLGATTTARSNTENTISNAVTQAMNTLTGKTKESATELGSQTSRGLESQTSRGSQAGTTTGFEKGLSTSDILNTAQSNSEQNATQSATGVTSVNQKAKTKDSGKCLGTLIFVVALGTADDGTELETLRGFRDTYLASTYPESIPEYYKLSNQSIPKLMMLSSSEQDSIIQIAHTKLFVPMIQAIQANNPELAYESYAALLQSMRSGEYHA